uniref:SCA7 domain-containing protein n=1 Tax=Panagrellus redivivus TaxID=6233 RepID=A0A7E4VS97_PANRE
MPISGSRLIAAGKDPSFDRSPASLLVVSHALVASKHLFIPMLRGWDIHTTTSTLQASITFISTKKGIASFGKGEIPRISRHVRIDISITMLSFQNVIHIGYFILIIFATTVISEERHVRQVSLDDLIHSALQLVKPIFDTSEPLRDPDSPMIPKKSAQDDVVGSFDSRAQAALGVEEESGFKDAPICRGNSQLCKFIACSAHNFKHDQSFANLNLAAQLMSDKKLRKTITNNPESVVSVCREQGLSDGQCRIFAQGFQVIDRFITVVEPAEGGSGAAADNPNAKQTVRGTPVINNEPLMDSIPHPLRPIGRGHPPILGSRTWSTHVNRALSTDPTERIIPAPPTHVATRMVKTAEQRTPFVFSNNDGAGIFAPMASAPIPIQPVISRPMAKVPQGAGIAFSSDWDAELDQLLSIPPRPREKRDTDYYDQVEEHSGNGPATSGAEHSEGESGVGHGLTGTDDYYDQVEGEKKPSGSARSGSQAPSGYQPMNCFALLG